jgi:putative phage-type endonuclease
MSRRGSIYQIDGLRSTYVLNMSEEKWLELRRRGIGGSDIGAILGLNQYKTPLTVWMEKRGLAKPQEPNVHMEFGTRMEPVLRKWAQDEIGGGLTVLSSPYLYEDPTANFLIANIDGVVLEGENVMAGLELKTASDWQAKWWKGEEIPDSYYAQVQHYMGVTSIGAWYIGALVGKEFFTRLVPANPEFIAQAKRRATEFWTQCVLANVMPAPTGAEADLDALVELFPGGGDKVIDDPDMEPALENYRNAKARAKEYEELANAEKAKIEARIGDAKVLIAGDLKASWPRFDVERVDADALRANHPEVYEQVKKTSHQGRLTVGPITKKEKAE